MITTKTVLVLGAGASAPYGFPTGSTLKDRIIKPQGMNTHQILKSLGFGSDKVREFTDVLRESGQSSVDAFLERRLDLRKVGQAAIAATLLACEGKHQLYGEWIDKRLRRDKEKEFEDSWYDLLFQMLTEGATKWDDLRANQLSVVTFNYDRSLETFLFTALKNSYGLDEITAAKAASFVPVTHVYGSLGLLPWQSSQKDEAEVVPYATSSQNDLPLDYVKRAADSIVILPEGEMNSEAFCEARRQLVVAQHVYFLGFGYHPTNLSRLGMRSESMPEFPENQIAGTISGLPAWLEGRIYEFRSLQSLRRERGNLLDERVYSFLHRHVMLQSFVSRPHSPR